MTTNQALPGPPGRVRRLLGSPALPPQEPILAELFSVERLEQHAQSLAVAQTVTSTPRRGHPIRPRVTENGRVLLESYRVLARAIKDDQAITPAAEWLVDNFHIVDEQLREIFDDLPSNYYRELPKLADGPLTGYPRVLGLAWAYIAHTDSRFDPESLRRTVRAYQSVQPLTIGELWAIAISLRILLVENLRRVSEDIVQSRAARQRADELADSLLGLGPEAADSGGPEFGAATRRRLSRVAMSAAARVQLFQRLRDQDPALQTLAQLPVADGTSAEEVVRLEHQQQATMNVTVRNVITSMRTISWFDWASFVESVSLVDEVLRARSSFGDMDFATRDRYRHAVEVVARGTGLTEVEVAAQAATMAEAAAAAETVPETRNAAPVEPAAAAEASPAEPDGKQARPSPRADPGYYLISDGRPELERRPPRQGAVRPPPSTCLPRGCHAGLPVAAGSPHGPDPGGPAPPRIR